jgi:hypothetical protein
MKIEIGDKIEVSHVFKHYPQGEDIITRVTNTRAFGQRFAYQREFDGKRVYIVGKPSLYSAYFVGTKIDSSFLPKEYQD